MEDEGCPRCKTTKYRNPSLKLMVNICGHTLCDTCVELLFVKGSNSCPECGVPLRRNNFRVQLFDACVEKELDIRKRILRDYNKKEEDFATLDHFNDYLEEIETIIYNLCNDIDQLETNKKIEAYKKENRDTILKNKIRSSKEEYELDILLEQEREQIELKKQELQCLEVVAKKKKTIEKEALIDELMFSQENAASIIKTFANKVEEEKEKLEAMPPPPPQRSTNFSTGIKFGSGFQQQFLPVPKADEGPLYSYENQFFDNLGPPVPGMEELQEMNYTKHIRNENLTERAGGFLTKISCQRAIQEAMQGLYHGF